MLQGLQEHKHVALGLRCVQDVIDGVNYENTGELGAEMGGKPVEHGLEVPPNAVRACSHVARVPD